MCAFNRGVPSDAREPGNVSSMGELLNALDRADCSVSREWRRCEKLCCRAVGEGELAIAISLAVCTRDARVAAGCPYREEKSEDAWERRRGRVGILLEGIGSPRTDWGVEDEAMEGGLETRGVS